ncbi:MAG: hypothetical protein GX892_02065 [Thermoanaerobacteraceae bacterium]|nr:hypothetical protein [Thermoanaerobacteraceae bacterium]
MARKTRSIRKSMNSNHIYADILDLLSQEEDIADEDIAHYANIDIDTVKSIKQKWVSEETPNPLKK